MDVITPRSQVVLPQFLPEASLATPKNMDKRATYYVTH